MPRTERRIFSISEGDQKEFRQLVNASADHLFHTAMNCLKNKELAEVVVNDLIISIREHPHHLTEIQNRKAWMMKCFKNTFVTHIRRNRFVNNGSNYSHEKLPVSQNTISNFEQQIVAGQSHHAIIQSPQRCRLIFSLVNFKGSGDRDVAVIRNYSHRTVNIYDPKKIRESEVVLNKYTGDISVKNKQAN